MAATPSDHCGRTPALALLGPLLRARFDHTAQEPDLDRAIAVAREALGRTGDDDPDRAGYLLELGTGLRTRFDQAGTLRDGDDALAALRSGL